MGYHASSLFPTPVEEFGEFISTDQRCAVLSVRAIIRWFPRSLRHALGNEGYRLVILDVPDSAIVNQSQTQVVFIAEHARIIKWLSLIPSSRAAQTVAATSSPTVLPKPKPNLPSTSGTERILLPTCRPTSNSFPSA